jgi:hypothetical protein
MYKRSRQGPDGTRLRAIACEHIVKNLTREKIVQRLHDDGRPDRRFVGLSSDAKVNFLEKAQRSDTVESLECVTALSFFPVAWYFAQTKPHKSAVLIVALTVRKREFPQKCSPYVPVQKVRTLQNGRAP